MNVFISSLYNVETLLKSEMIFVNPLVKLFCHLTNDWSFCECPQNGTICNMYIISSVGGNTLQVTRVT